MSIRTSKATYSSVAAFICAGHLACQARDETAETSRNPPPKADEIRTDPLWHYLPTLRAALSEALVVHPVLEFDDPSRGEVHVVAVVGRVAGPRLELWGFDQTNKAGVLRPSSPPVVLLDFAGSEMADDAFLRDFARRLASPHTSLRRTSGVDRAAEPREVLEVLSTQARHLVDPTTDPHVRANALFALSRALRDEPLLRPSSVLGLIRVLAHRAMTVTSVERLGERRARLQIAAGPDRLEIEMMRAGQGWMVSSIRAISTPAAPAPP